MNEVYDFLREARVFYLATVENNKPHVRPFGGLNIYDGKLYIQTNKNKNVAHQMENNPNIEICALNKEKWIRISATAIKDEDIKAKESMLENSLPQIREKYREDDESEVLYLNDATATIYKPNGESEIIKF